MRNGLFSVRVKYYKKLFYVTFFSHKYLGQIGNALHMIIFFIKTHMNERHKMLLENIYNL